MDQNQGVIEPLSEQAKVNIHVSISTQLNEERNNNRNDGDNPFPLDPGVSTAELCGVNARTAVFHNPLQASKASKMDRLNHRTNLLQNDVRVIQAIDGLKQTTIDNLEFVGIAIDEINAAQAAKNTVGSHAACAVRISGTITAQNPTRVSIPNMAKVRWTLPEKGAKCQIHNFKRQSLPVWEEASPDRVNRLINQFVPKFNDSNFAITTQPYLLGLIQKFYDVMTQIQTNAQQTSDEETQARIIEASIRLVEPLISWDDRHVVGTCLHTKEGEIDLLLKQ